jgi:hypothetical protein
LTTIRSAASYALLIVLLGATPCRAVELRLGREALEHTMRQQLFNGSEGRHSVRGAPGKACPVYAQDAELSFAQDRIVVRVKTHAWLGRAMHGACLGISLAPTGEVALPPHENLFGVIRLGSA